MPNWLHVDMYHYSISQWVFRSFYVVFIMWMMDYLYWSVYFLNDNMLIKIQIPYLTVQRDSALNEEIWSQWILRIVTESICCDTKCYVASIWKNSHRICKTYHDKNMVMIIPADNYHYIIKDFQKITWFYDIMP